MPFILIGTAMPSNSERRGLLVNYSVFSDCGVGRTWDGKGFGFGKSEKLAGFMCG